MGTPAFPNLGKHCSVDDCRLIDFLPFTCDCCHKVYICVCACVYAYVSIQFIHHKFGFGVIAVCVWKVGFLMVLLVE